MIPAMTPRRSRSAAISALLALVLVAACGNNNPSPSAFPSAVSPLATATSGASPVASVGASASAAPSSGAPSVDCSTSTAAASFAPRPIGPDDPNAPLLASIERSVQAIRGLTATKPVPRNTVDQASLCAYLRQSMDRDNPPEFVAATERLYQELGLLAPGVSLEKAYLDLRTGQVIGFYDETTKQMYLVSSSGGFGPIQQITYAHEYDHALQDQAFGVQAVIGTAKDQSDRSLARLALVEGDATLLMSLWAQQNLTPGQLIQAASAADPASQAALDAAPPILRQTALWPYLGGLNLVRGAYQTSASYAGVDALWRNPPDTTEQVLHPDKLTQREPAIPVSFPADFAKRLGPGWKLTLGDTLGEVELNVLMQTGDDKAGPDPAAGWGGDRVALVQGPGGVAGAAVDTRWDSSTAAGNAFDELQKLVLKLNGQGKHAAVLMPSATRVVLVSADSDAILGAIANVLGLAG
jgi:hypothetical protein